MTHKPFAESVNAYKFDYLPEKTLQTQEEHFVVMLFKHTLTITNFKLIGTSTC